MDALKTWGGAESSALGKHQHSKLIPWPFICLITVSVASRETWEWQRTGAGLKRGSTFSMCSWLCWGTGSSGGDSPPGSSSCCHQKPPRCLNSPGLGGWEMGRIIALITPKGFRSREIPPKTTPQSTEKHQKESQCPSVVTSAPPECKDQLGTSEVWQTPGWGHKHFSKPSADLSVFSPQDEREERGGCCGRAARGSRAGLGGRCSPGGGAGRFPEPRLTSAGRRHHHSPGCSWGPENIPKPRPGRRGLSPSGLSQCHQGWGHLWGPGIPAVFPAGRHRTSWAGSCSPSLWYIQDFSWNLPHCFLLFWRSRGCRRWECCRHGRFAVHGARQGPQEHRRWSLRPGADPEIPIAPNPHHLPQQGTAGEDCLHLCITGKASPISQ